MNESDKRIAAYAIEKMFRGRTFDICTIREAAKLLGCTPSGKAFERLQLVHCHPWGDIPPDILQMIPVWINEVLGGPRLSVAAIPALREGNDHIVGTEDLPQLPRGRA